MEGQLHPHGHNLSSSEVRGQQEQPGVSKASTQLWFEMTHWTDLHLLGFGYWRRGGSLCGLALAAPCH